MKVPAHRIVRTLTAKEPKVVKPCVKNKAKLMGILIFVAPIKPQTLLLTKTDYLQKNSVLQKKQQRAAMQYLMPVAAVRKRLLLTYLQ